MVRKTVVPAPASERMTLQSSCRLRVSSPVVGSSRNSTAGAHDEAERQVEPTAHAAGVGADPAARGIREVESFEQLGGAGAGLATPEARRGGPSS